MKTTAVVLASTSLFAALALAAPVPQSTASQTVDITFKSGDGDSATVITATLDQLLVTANNSQASAGVAATVNSGSAQCQAFSDAAATEPLGNAFNAQTSGPFTNLANGGVDSILADAVPVGAFLCSASIAGLAKDEAALTTSSSSSSSSSSTVRIELQTEADTFVQGEVPVDGSIFLTAETIFGEAAISALLVDATGIDLNKVSCVAFSDALAKHEEGLSFTNANGGAALSSSTIEATKLEAFKCTVSA
ncbi:hypothetical protein MMC13_005988 [Lambiella insularis]|nr:hypothetical protein [Lambiella insularis]